MKALMCESATWGVTCRTVHGSWGARASSSASLSPPTTAASASGRLAILAMRSRRWSGVVIGSPRAILGVQAFHSDRLAGRKLEHTRVVHVVHKVGHGIEAGEPAGRAGVEDARAAEGR